MFIMEDCYRIRLIVIGLAFNLAIKLAIILLDLTFKCLIGPQGNSLINYILGSTIYLNLYTILNC